MTQDREAKYDEIVDLIARHAERLLYEDLLFPLMRKAVKEVGDELKNECPNEAKNLYGLCGSYEECENTCNFIDQWLEKISRLVYAKRNEPVRIGAFRTLLNEMYFRIHGDVSGGIDAVTHGIIGEAKREIKITLERQLSGWSSLNVEERSYSIGIDYIRILSYPNSNPSTSTRYSTVAVPLFVIAKSGDKSDIKKLKKDLDEAISATLNKLNEFREYDPQLSSIEIALKNMKIFTRVVLTRIVDVDADKHVNRAELINEIKRRLQDHRCSESVDEYGLVVYTDIPCGLINIVLRDIPQLYRIVIDNEDLTKVTAADWVSALLMLGAPLANIEVMPARSTPKDPSSTGIDLDSLVKRVRKIILEHVNNVIETVDYQRNELSIVLRDAMHEMLKEIASKKESTVLNRRALLIGG